MITIYEYIFYKLYKYSLRSERLWGTGHQIPQWLAIFYISVLAFFNLITLFVIINHFLVINITFSRLHGFIIAIIFYSVNYFLFLKGKRYKKIAEKLDKDTKRSKILKDILFWVYVVMTFVLFFTILPMFAPNRN